MLIEVREGEYGANSTLRRFRRSRGDDSADDPMTGVFEWETPVHHLKTRAEIICIEEGYQLVFLLLYQGHL